MNDTGGLRDPPGGLASQKMNGFGYGVGVSVGILLLITTITLASYFCTRPPPDPNHPSSGNARAASADIETGLDEATLSSYPKLVYSRAIEPSASSCCSICLADYKDSDVLRVLPDCKHMFHLSCVDPWLRLHPTCPMCRTSPMPSPMATPQMEVVPLAMRLV